MRVSLEWLREFVDIEESPEELAELLTMLGVEAETGLHLDAINDVVVARVLSAEKHPNADKLKLCRVTDGNGTYPVVCGAPNVAADQVVPFARVGATLPGNITLRKVRIRGEVSEGMICSERELGVSDEHEGIMVLPDGLKLGIPVNDFLQERYGYLDLDLTPNRPDCLSHVGVAREIAVKTQRPFKYSPAKARTDKPEALKDLVTIKIENEIGCPRYVAGLVEDIEVKPSPPWMVERLKAAGLRSINTIVDISNYVLLETGHPTHIFDYDTISTQEVVIRNAHPEETIVTLDGQEFNLQPQHLLITDGPNAIALAGIMGGLNTAVQDTTRRVLIESAYFDPITIRKGAKSLGLMTEASKRFERGADPHGAWVSFWRVVDLLESLAGGKWVPGVIDAYPRPLKQPKIILRKSELDLVTGQELPGKFVETTLKSLGVEVQSKGSKAWECKAPSYRPDLEREIDLIEEVVRVYGYDQIPTTPDYRGVYHREEVDLNAGLLELEQLLAGLGYRQCYNNSLQDKRWAGSLGKTAVKLQNPLTETMTHLRTSLLPGLLKTIDYNIKNGNPDLRLFEVGHVFNQLKPGFEGIDERHLLAAVTHGNMEPNNVHFEVREHSFFSMKGIVQTLLRRCGLSAVNFTPFDSPLFTVGFEINRADEVLGHMGQVGASFIESLGLEMGTVYAFELDVRLLREYQQQQRRYQPIIPFPAVQRDINFVMEQSVPAERVMQTILAVGKPLLQQVLPIDLYTAERLGPNQKSLTFSLTFQSPEKTLEDKEVTSVINQIIDVVSSRFNAKLRR
ncbi:MAG: phenylalanine--tRNA ligase subunit beta [Fidelibacterota bacterium]